MTEGGDKIRSESYRNSDYSLQELLGDDWHDRCFYDSLTDYFDHNQLDELKSG